MLHSTYIYEDCDRVRAVAVRVAGVVYPASDALRTTIELRKLARAWKSKLELRARAVQNYDPTFQTYILTERGDWVPVDHVVWRGKDGVDIKLEFSGGQGYVSVTGKPHQRASAYYKAWRMLASAVLRHP